MDNHEPSPHDVVQLSKMGASGKLPNHCYKALMNIVEKRLSLDAVVEFSGDMVLADARRPFKAGRLNGP